MSFRTCSVHTVVRKIWPDWKSNKPAKHVVQKTYLATNQKDTFVLVFNISQKESFDALVNHPGVKVLLVTKPSVNGASGHGKTPRNCVVVFEYSTASADSDVPVSSV